MNMDSNKKTAHSDRSANFDDAEIKLLLDLIIRFKSVILNRSTNGSTNLAKEKIWRQLTTLFNKEKINVHRSSDHLKTKWFNLKREARRIHNNSPSKMNDVHKQVIQLSYESVNDPSLQIEISEQAEQDIYEVPDLETEEVLNDNTDDKLLDDNVSSSQSDIDDEQPLKDRDRCYKKRNGIRKKSMNFSAQECSLLLKLVKEEKHNLFLAGMSKEAIRKKYLAWERVAKRFNAISWKKRPVQVLKTKLENMRRLNRHKIRLSTSNTEHEEKELSVKNEPNVEYNIECSEFSQSMDEDRINEPSPIPNDMDPLRFVLNSDSGLGSTSICSQNDTDLIKLKMDLINYQLETAKLERQRVEDAIRADKEEQDSRAIENSLRLRTARLKALAAERKLNEDHQSALGYTEQEVLAMEYIKMFPKVT
ncbi:uncharacterized protein LOC110998101 [Pieris rapae]|uniref:uncharacterized protein LOC110998101 n=1 Tax=Pieris rapae TaxID=64459 RepID=UPI001E27B370|nr:uncharacterized protein LOC110998101 [Pieris rapae]XP_022122252.2 uncharacterized protein LOC110998101 [Pieris rapae]XP_022122254.2 uncharacterized protein LOC110998101 [Pieris rapae]